MTNSPNPGSSSPEPQYPWLRQPIPPSYGGDGPYPPAGIPPMQQQFAQPTPQPWPQSSPPQQKTFLAVKNRGVQLGLRITTAVVLVMCLLIAGLAVGGNSFLLYVMDPPIHAAHHRGAPVRSSVEERARQGYMRNNLDEFKTWGMEQTPDWIANCNKINRRALRKFGFDPQKDLENRRGGSYVDVCSWTPGGANSILGVDKQVLFRFEKNYTIAQFYTNYPQADVTYLPNSNRKVAVHVRQDMSGFTTLCTALREAPQGFYYVQVSSRVVQHSRQESCAIALDMVGISPLEQRKNHFTM